MYSEKNRLEKIASDSLYTTMSNIMMINYCFGIFLRFLKKGSILELGPAEGIMTEKLYNFSNDLTLVEGSSIFCDQLRERYTEAKIVNTLFENFSPKERFDNIVLGHVLEHVEDPVQILSKAKEWLAPNGIILAAVPNSHSIHRQAAVLMDILETEESMSELDIHHGHRRIYNPYTFRKDFKNAHLNVIQNGGYWLKPLSNGQIHSSWTKEMLYSFMQLGERYPDIAAEIYIIAK